MSNDGNYINNRFRWVSPFSDELTEDFIHHVYDWDKVWHLELPSVFSTHNQARSNIFTFALQLTQTTKN